MACLSAFCYSNQILEIINLKKKRSTLAHDFGGFRLWLVGSVVLGLWGGSMWQWEGVAIGEGCAPKAPVTLPGYAPGTKWWPTRPWAPLKGCIISQQCLRPGTKQHMRLQQTLFQTTARGQKWKKEICNYKTSRDRIYKTYEENCKTLDVKECTRRFE